MLNRSSDLPLTANTTILCVATFRSMDRLRDQSAQCDCRHGLQGTIIPDRCRKPPSTLSRRQCHRVLRCDGPSSNGMGYLSVFPDNTAATDVLTINVMSAANVSSLYWNSLVPNSRAAVMMFVADGCVYVACNGSTTSKQIIKLTSTFFDGGVMSGRGKPLYHFQLADNAQTTITPYAAQSGVVYLVNDSGVIFMINTGDFIEEYNSGKQVTRMYIRRRPTEQNQFDPPVVAEAIPHVIFAIAVWSLPWPSEAVDRGVTVEVVLVG